MIKAIAFDFGGVLAEEGFKNGLKAIAGGNGLDPDLFYEIATELVYQTGYIVGRTNEAVYWQSLRDRTGITGDDGMLRRELLDRFVLRPEMFRRVDEIRMGGCVTAILSDQTNWLEELEEKSAFSRHFDYVFNSFKTGKSKRDVSVFRDTCGIMGVEPDETIFVDDNEANTERAASTGINVICFVGIESFERELEEIMRNSCAGRK